VSGCADRQADRPAGPVPATPPGWRCGPPRAARRAHRRCAAGGRGPSRRAGRADPGSRRHHRPPRPTTTTGGRDRCHRPREPTMIGRTIVNLLGVILLTAGLTLIGTGTVLAVLGATGRTPGGRKYGTDRKYRR